jgi:hypothetical protein
MILHVEPRILGEYPNPALLARLQQRSKRLAFTLRRTARKYLKQSVTIVCRPVPIMEIAGLADQITELASLKAEISPRDLGDRTCPGFRNERW